MKAQYPRMVVAWDAKDVVGGSPSSDGRARDLCRLMQAPETLSNCCRPYSTVENSNYGCKKDVTSLRMQLRRPVQNPSLYVLLEGVVVTW